MWRVVRQDDNGNRYLVAEHLTEEQARVLAADLEARAHKQIYELEEELEAQR